jgi:hypothetical protein
MTTPHPSRDLSTLVGTSKTLERAISGLQMSSQRLMKLVSDEPESAGLAGLVTALQKLTAEDQAIVDAILSHRGKPKRKHK